MRKEDLDVRRTARDESETLDPEILPEP